MKAGLFGLALLPTVALAQAKQPRIGNRSAPIIVHDGLRFRDLNRNGSVDPYEDWRLTPEARARDLVARMTLEEIAGTMMHGTARTSGNGIPGAGAAYDTAANRVLIDSVKVTSMITRLFGDAASIASQNNALQEIAERTRLGIPLTISTDPRNHFQDVVGQSVATPVFSQWPETLGFAAIGDSALVRRFGDVARQEHRAVGIQMALSPQADLATEPRWGRIAGTFGEDADLAQRMVRAYVEGFQHGARGIDTGSVAAIVKHWVGYGAARDGFDSHSFYGRFATYGAAKGASNIMYHIRPFLGAFRANVAGVMPTYSILQGATWDGRPIEQVGAGFNKQILTDILRAHYGFRGIVLTDWAITNDCGRPCREGAAPGQRPSFTDLGMPWGAEDLPMRSRFVKAVQAGVDQFGGSERVDMLIGAVHAGQLTKARLDSSAVRVLTLKFALGLFEDPYVDTTAAQRIVGNAQFRAAGIDAQRRATVLLENKGGMLPLRQRTLRVYTRGIAPAAITREGWTSVTDPAQADVAIIRIAAPSQRLHPGYLFGQFIHEGSLAFSDTNPELEELERVSAKAPTVAVVYLDRPAIVTPLKEHSRALIASFGTSDDALLDVVTGRARPEGKLPFDLPASMSAVLAQRSDLAHDIQRPLYPFGYGLRYGSVVGTTTPAPEFRHH